MVKGKQESHTSFGLCISQHTSPDSLKRILQMLDTFVVKKLELDMAGYFESYRGSAWFEEERFSPATFTQAVPLLESLKLTADYFNCDIAPALTRLHTLELVITQHDTKEIAYLGQLFPFLQHLTFSSCELDIWCTSKRHIDLPAINHHIPTVQRKDSKPSRSLIAGDAFIRISTERCHPISFFSRSNKPLLQLSDEDFDLYSQHAQLISIQCQSLRHVKVDLGGVKLKLKFDEEGKVKYSTPSIVDSDATTLSERTVSLGDKIKSLEKRYALARKYFFEAQIQEIEHELSNK